MANHGFGSRKDVRRIIKAGEVTVDGQVVTDFDFHLDISTACVEVEGERLQLVSNIYIMMNKPQDVVCSAKEGDHQTVFDLLDQSLLHQYLGGNLSMVGRLDLDTEGLLILTTDGSLNHFLTSPKNRIPKVYQVTLEKNLGPGEQDEYRRRLLQGIHIAADGHEAEADCLPAECKWLGENTCHLKIYEGMYHEVKRMFLALGNRVTFLKRISFGGLSLDSSLGAGEYRELSADEVELLKAND